MKQKVIIVLVFLTLLAMAVLLWQTSRVPEGWKTYQDETNKVSFIYPENWIATSQAGYVTLIPKSDNNKSVLLTINPGGYFLELAGLTKEASHLRIGKKDFLISQKEEKIRDPQDTAKFLDKSKTFTHLLWTDKTGTKYWFQISPWQENFDRETYKILDSFRIKNGR